jgi:hypothetical protein
MNVNFATSNPATALKYLTTALPKKNLTKETAAPIIDLVRAGKIRVGDPFMYRGSCPIFPEPSCTPDDQQIVSDWYGTI